MGSQTGWGSTARFDNTGASIDALLQRAGRRLVVATPLGIGKPNHWLNTLYDRAVSDASIDLHIVTGLSLESRRGKHPLERRFWKHVNGRLHGDYPHLKYLRDYRDQQLPGNVRVSEFFLEPGAHLHNRYAQRNYLSTNYTHVWRDMLNLGANVVAQMIAPSENGDRYSLSCNSDVTLKLIREIPREEMLVVGEVNPSLPYMYGPADVPREMFDLIVEDPAQYHEILAVPAAPLTTADYLIGLHSSTLVKDGGTIEIGFGSIGDAVAYCLWLRHRHNDLYLDLLQRAGIAARYRELIAAVGGTAPFDEGLYGASEMLSYGLFRLYREGICKRRNSEGIVLKAGFFLGPQRFYQELRDLPKADRQDIWMAGIDDINQIYGADPQQKRRDRHDARYINNAMMVTALGAVVSDGLADGRVVSGVGGQYNFVAMAHALGDARSIIVLRSTRHRRSRLTSNVVWNYGHTTIPRHLRDIVITEFGIADLRGQSDENTVRQMLAVMHPHFRSEIVDAAWRANKIDTPTVKADERAAAGHEALLAAARRDGFFPTFPFGSDFNDDELAAAKALQQLQSARSMRGLLRIVSACLRAPADHGSANAVLNVLGLQDARGIRERIWRRVIAAMVRAT
jgi:acyl-CoA hydrolase